ncbi:MAG: FmdB family zinc ribbon protein [Armatimonadota bacterium]
MNMEMIFEYRCSECGYNFAMSEPLGTPEGGRECPKCESRDTRRVISKSSMSCKCNEGGCNIDG